MPAGFVMVLAEVVPAGCGVAVSRLTGRCRGTGSRAGEPASQVITGLCGPGPCVSFFRGLLPWQTGAGQCGHRRKIMSCPNSMTGEGNHKTVARAKKAEQQDVLMRQG